MHTINALLALKIARHAEAIVGPVRKQEGLGRYS